jgi:phosphosulfolactate synthase (CoM biosynthesis protein A)
MNRPFPLVEYAQKIGKNTAELTAADMAKYMLWWMKQQPRKDILQMAKSYTTKKYKDAQTSRLAEQGIESPINDGEEEIVIHADETVCEMGLTKVDVDALLWALNEIFKEYDIEGTPYEASLKGLQEALKGV